MKPSEEKKWAQYYEDDAKAFDYPKMNIFDLVYEENKNRKDNIAIEYEGRKICYGEFFDKVDEHTDYFASKKIKESDIVTVSMLMTPEFIYDWYALGRLHAISNLIDPRTSVEGIKKYLIESKSKYILNTDLFISKLYKAIEDGDFKIINYNLGESANKMPVVLGVADKIFSAYSKALSNKDNRIQAYKANDHFELKHLPEYKSNMPLTIVHTGGTTGFPKGVLLSHDNYNAMAYEYMKSHIGFSPKDKFLLVMPPWISYGSGMLHMSMVTGMTSALISKLDSKKMADYLIKYKPQWFAGVPAHYKILCDNNKKLHNKLSFLKAGAVGGDSMSSELYNSSNDCLLKNGASKGVYPGYALTEATSAFAVKQLEKYKPGSVGIPLPGGTVGIFEYNEETGITIDNELCYNQIGEICLQTPNQMIGYLNNESLTNQVIKVHNDGKKWIHTGDLGHIDEDGILFVDGRIKEMIIRHDGFKVYPSLIEKIVSSNAGVSACKVVGVDDLTNNCGKVPKAYVVLKDEFISQGPKVIREIKDLCVKSLPKYYTEGLYFETVSKLPLTSIGKVDFNKLIEMDKEKRRVLLKE